MRSGTATTPIMLHVDRNQCSECCMYGYVYVWMNGEKGCARPRCQKIFCKSAVIACMLQQMIDSLLVLQAFWRALNSVFGDKIQFKTTLKGASMMMNSALRDLWVPGLCFFLLFATMIAGLIELFTGVALVFHLWLYSTMLLTLCIPALYLLPPPHAPAQKQGPPCCILCIALKRFSRVKTVPYLALCCNVSPSWPLLHD